ncbi:MAG: HAD hydrolase family protein [Burkholderiaceae bacterium]|jgi:3-deoxy-D-manno-octulosonate 8-phosphate phosphatase (KDO 8-P phosphatase)|nr:HAD hydrolase family protein [Burkholderiaceae bacterium]
MTTDATTPALGFAPELLLRAQGIRAVLLDVDGVCTDGGIYFSAEGEALKRFHTLDGHGLKLLRQAGIVPVVISGRDSDALRRRLGTLGIEHCLLGVADKLPAAQRLLDQLGLTWRQCAAMGDDWPDLPLLARAALACAPPNAQAEVRARVHHITAAPGGAGAVRELCDLLLIAGGHYHRLLAAQLSGGSDAAAAADNATTP